MAHMRAATPLHCEHGVKHVVDIASVGIFVPISVQSTFCTDMGIYYPEAMKSAFA